MWTVVWAWEHSMTNRYCSGLHAMRLLDLYHNISCLYRKFCVRIYAMTLWMDRCWCQKSCCQILDYQDAVAWYSITISVVIKTNICPLYDRCSGSKSSFYFCWWRVSAYGCFIRFFLYIALFILCYFLHFLLMWYTCSFAVYTFFVYWILSFLVEILGRAIHICVNECSILFETVLHVGLHVPVNVDV